MGLGLPAALTRDTLRVVMGDFLGEVRIGYPDDWLGIALQARSLTTDRLTDSVATLTVDGPLVPPAYASRTPPQR